MANPVALLFATGKLYIKFDLHLSAISYSELRVGSH